MKTTYVASFFSIFIIFSAFYIHPADKQAFTGKKHKPTPATQAPEKGFFTTLFGDTEPQPAPAVAATSSSKQSEQKSTPSASTVIITSAQASNLKLKPQQASPAPEPDQAEFVSISSKTADEALFPEAFEAPTAVKPTAITAATMATVVIAQRSLATAVKNIKKLLGDAYELPTLPEQKATEYSLTDFHVLRSDEAYILGLITNGTFNLATNKGPLQDSKLEGRNSNALQLLMQKLSTLQKTQEQAITTMLEQHRNETNDAINQMLLILLAINQNQTKRVAINVLEECHKEINNVRHKRENLQFLQTAEYKALNEHLFALQQAIRTTHNNPTVLPASIEPNMHSLIAQLEQLKNART